MSDSETKSFIRPGKILLLVVLAALVYFAALVVWVPAGWLWQQVSGKVSLPPQVVVQQVSGRVWDGAASLVVAGHPVRLDWTLDWPSLTALALPVKIDLTSSRSSLTGSGRIGWPDRGVMNIRGRIGVAEFEDLIRRNGGAVIEGDVVIERLNLQWVGQRIVSASGIGLWDGGLVTWPMGNQTGQADFPPMEAILDSSQGGVELTVSPQGGDGPAAGASISWKGMMKVRVYKRMVDLAGQPWPDSARPGDIIFQVRQKLLPGAR